MLPATLSQSSSSSLLSDPTLLSWIAIGVGIITIIIMLRQLYYGKRRQYKEISYSKLADTLLISVDTRAEREKIRILYNNKEVKDMHLVILKIWNSGTIDLPIYKYDEQTESFEKPYQFIFERRTLVARSVLETEPLSGVIEKRDLEAYQLSIEPETNTISLPHCLLKPKQAITLRILLTGLPSELKTEGKLANCELKEYGLIEERTKFRNRMILFFTIFFTLLFVANVFSLIFFSHLDLALVEFALLLLIILTAILTALQLTYSLIMREISTDK